MTECLLPSMHNTMPPTFGWALVRCIHIDSGWVAQFRVYMPGDSARAIRYGAAHKPIAPHKGILTMTSGSEDSSNQDFEWFEEELRGEV